jgi:hypothetical protein
MSSKGSQRVLDILLGVLVAFVAQVAYDVVSNAGNPVEWQDRLLGGITVFVLLLFITLVVRLILSGERALNEEMNAPKNPAVIEEKP